MVRRAAVLLAALAVAGCGGGGGGGGESTTVGGSVGGPAPTTPPVPSPPPPPPPSPPSPPPADGSGPTAPPDSSPPVPSPSPPPPPPPPAPNLTVLFRDMKMASFVPEEVEGTLGFTAYLQHGPTTLPVFADLQYDKATLTLQGEVVQNASGEFKVSFKTNGELGEGSYGGQIQLRLCAEPACKTVYPGTTYQMAYSAGVTLKDWATFQRDAAHTGYVRLTVDVPKITKLWEHNNTDAISKLAADFDRVYFTTGGGFGGASTTASIRAIKTSDGKPAWNYDLGTMAYIGDPAIAGRKVFVSSMVSSSDSNPITVLDAATGTHKATGRFASQWSYFLAPVSAGDDIYTASGYYGNVVYSHRQSDASMRWSSAGSGYNVWNVEAPAVDGSRVYYYTGAGLDAINRLDGSRAFSIADPYQTWNGYDYGGGPVILKDGSVLAYSGTTGGANSFGPTYLTQRPLVRYLPETQSIGWRTADAYRTQPATRGDLIFVARNNPSRFDALRISDGKIAWSWTPPATATFVGATLVTDNVVFVSTNEKVYAISLKDHVPVWTYDNPGLLAIAPNNVLLIAEAVPVVSTFMSNGRITAFMLRSQ